MKHIFRQLALAPLLLFGVSQQASAHCIVGNRFFPATLIVEDPCVADELALPTVSSLKDDEGREVEISGEYAKTITKNFGVGFEEAWVHVDQPNGGNIAGFDNLGTSFKYQLVRSAPAELALSVALDVDWGGTGSKSIGVEPFSTLVPTAFIGKGFNFMPESLKLLRPLAITAQAGYAMPTHSSSTEENEDTGLIENVNNPQVLVWGGTLQYSMPYLKSAVRDFGLPGVINHLIPIVELSMETQMSNFDGEKRTTGTVNPGLMYIGDKYQLSAEAILPINDASGDGVGVIGQLHFYLDDIFPNSIGKPIFGPAADTGAY